MHKCGNGKGKSVMNLGTTKGKRPNMSDMKKIYGVDSKFGSTEDLKKVVFGKSVKPSDPYKIHKMK